MKVEPLDKHFAKAASVRASARAPVWLIPAVKAALFLVDIVVIPLCFVAAFYMREDQTFFHNGSWAWSESFAPYGSLLIFIFPIRILTFAYYELYRLRGEFSFAEEALRVFKAVAIGSLLIVAMTFIYRGGFEFRNFSYSRGVFLLDFAFALGAFGFLRLSLRAAQAATRRKGINLIPALIVGRGEEAALCLRELREKPEIGYRVVGIVNTEEDTGEEDFNGAPIVGNLKDLAGLVRATNTQEIIITDQRVSGDFIFEVMMSLGRKRRAEFRLAPSLFNYLPRKTEIDQLGHLPMIRLFRDPLSDMSRIFKRITDIVIAFIALVVSSPFWLIVSLLVKLDSRGPILYKQERVGMDGRVFLFYKFRSMRTGTDDRPHREAYLANIAGQDEANAGDETKPVYGKVQGDPRITRIGKFLRRYSLDEIPQLFNVLRGDMSIVGPRPPIPYEVEAYELWHRQRLDMKPGMTGLWQVSGRNRLSFEEMIKLDLFYIENWSLLLDVKIIFKTLPAMLRGDNDY